MLEVQVHNTRFGSPKVRKTEDSFLVFALKLSIRLPAKGLGLYGSVLQNQDG